MRFVSVLAKAGRVRAATPSTRQETEMELAAHPGLSPLTPSTDTPELLASVWRGEAAPPTAIATVIATIELGLIAVNGTQDPKAAARIWRDRPVARALA